MPLRPRLALLLTTVLLLGTALAPTADAAPALDGRFAVSDQPGRLKLGPDGNVWFTLGGAKELGRITPAGAVTEYDTPTNGRVLRGVTAGAPGTVWFSYNGGVLEWNIAAGNGIEHAVGQIDAADGIARDGAGNLWVVDTTGSLVVLNPNGTFNREIAFGGGSSGRDIVLGADGRMWWVDFAAAAVRATPADAVNATTTQTTPVGGNPQDLAAAPSGTVAYSNPAPPHRVGRLSSAGALLGESPTGAATDPFGAAFGGDGAFWFAGFAANAIFRVDAGDGSVSSLPVGAGTGPRRIAAGAQNTLWVALETSKEIARITGVEPPPPPPAPPAPPAVAPPVATPDPTPRDRGDVVAPVLSRVRLSRTRFRVGRAATAIDAQRRRRRILPAGTTLSFRSSEAATVLLRIDRGAPGRLRGGRCVRPTRGMRGARRCMRWSAVARLRRRVPAGLTRVAFSGRIGTRALPPGRYRFVLTAFDAAGNASVARTARFELGT